MDRFQELLRTKYDIPVKDYFTLSDEDKEGIVDIVIQYYEKNLMVNPEMIYLYLKILTEQISISIESDQFERADIMTRTRKRLNDLIYED
ncbi:hypothetical protein UFOVP323_35 [uncultured Caudovirales phage]|uniref:Uncharacterized protein n=1 Tax=uncultured Caudovirales phage TaxID=2100421 RepID=A0A6J5LTV2_9CAUD|nr:hypothetical protein UFOVP323_35 [uncultured Caudovirales phage]